MNYSRFETEPKFWRSYKKLTQAQKEAALIAWRIFRRDPFDARLSTHRVHALSAATGQTVYSVVIEPDLRAVFYLRGNTVVTLDIGTHVIYRA